MELVPYGVHVLVQPGLEEETWVTTRREPAPTTQPLESDQLRGKKVSSRTTSAHKRFLPRTRAMAHFIHSLPTPHPHSPPSQGVPVSWKRPLPFVGLPVHLWLLAWTNQTSPARSSSLFPLWSSLRINYSGCGMGSLTTPRKTRVVGVGEASVPRCTFSLHKSLLRVLPLPVPGVEAV